MPHYPSTSAVSERLCSIYIRNIYALRSEVLLVSLLIVTDLNYIKHKYSVCRLSTDAQKKQKYLDNEALARMKDLVDGAGLNCLWRATDNGSWLTAILQRLNGTELSREELQDNLLLQYGIFPLNLPTECDGCGKKLLVTHDLL